MGSAHETGRRLAIVGNQAFAMRNFRGALISALVAKGIEVLALAPDYTDEDRSAIENLGGIPVDYPLKRASISPFYDLVTLQTLTRLLRGVAPDVVLSFSAKPVIFGTIAAWRARVPRRYALIEGLGHAFIGGKGIRARLLRQVTAVLYRAALSGATRTLFLNDDDRRDFINNGLVADGRALTVGAIGIDLKEWRIAPPMTNPITFLFAGRLLREKGIIEFIEAARRVKTGHTNVRFVVLGAPDTNPSSIEPREAKAWVEEGLVEWPGQVDVKPWLASASVFVLPSYREGVPRSTQEALAMGRPIITTDVPGCRETVEDGINGFLIPPRDADALARAMLSFVNSPSLVQAMGLKSRELAEDRFDVEVALSRMLGALDL